MQGIFTISVKAIEKITSAAAIAGVAPVELYRVVDLDPAMLDDPDNRIPFSQLVELYEQGARLTGDDDFGLHVGERTSVKMFDIVGYAVANSRTLGDALSRAVRYHTIWNDGAEFRLELDDALAHLVYRYVDLNGAECRQDSEMTMSMLIKFAREVTGVDWTPREVCFQHDAPPVIRAHERIFRAPVRFSMPVSKLVFDRALLKLPLIEADPILSAVLDRHAEELLAKLPRRGGLTDEVRALLRQAINGGDPSLEAVSQQLNLSPRTLQRKLKEEHTSHQDLLDEMRRDLSVRYLREPEMAICEVAYLLGFSEPSAFHRAFRRWTGTTPREYRRTYT
ncbi:MAG: AraC family transcriptional regulator [Pyrinomonadaceae bacterium]|nr:AraC family transcriptional regulator [Pyrinomonadaceae bacterium]